MSKLLRILLTERLKQRILVHTSPAADLRGLYKSNGSIDSSALMQLLMSRHVAKTPADEAMTAVCRMAQLRWYYDHLEDAALEDAGMADDAWLEQDGGVQIPREMRELSAPRRKAPHVPAQMDTVLDAATAPSIETDEEEDEEDDSDIDSWDSLDEDSPDEDADQRESPPSSPLRESGNGSRDGCTAGKVQGLGISLGGVEGEDIEMD